MKKTLIALAVAGTAIAAGANASELYNQDGTSLTIGGRAEARLSVLDGDSSDVSRVRINVLGKQQITDSLYGLGFYEAEYNTNDDGTDSTSDNIDTRYIYAGMGGSFGQVAYGKQDGALVAITNFTDIMDYHGGNAAQEVATAGDHLDNMLTYTGSFNDFTVNASYRFADRNDDANTADATDYSTNHVSGYAVSGIYNLTDTGLAFGLGMADQNGRDTTGMEGSDFTAASAQQYILTASYTNKDLYLAAMYVNKDYDNTSTDYNGYELAAQYTLGKTVFMTNYENGNNTNDGATDSLKINDWSLEVAYKFKPNFKAYIDYDINFVDGHDYANNIAAIGTSEDEAVLGLRYDF